MVWGRGVSTKLLENLGNSVNTSSYSREEVHVLITLNVLVIELIIELLNNIHIYVCIGSAVGRGSFIWKQVPPREDDSNKGKRILR